MAYRVTTSAIGEMTSFAVKTLVAVAILCGCNSARPQQSPGAIGNRHGGSCLISVNANDLKGVDTTMDLHLRIYAPNGVMGLDDIGNSPLSDDFDALVEMERKVAQSYHPSSKTVVIHLRVDPGPVPAQRVVTLLKGFARSANRCLPSDERLVLLLDAP